MKKNLFLASLLFLFCSAGTFALAQEYQEYAPDDAVSSAPGDQLLNPEELEDLLAPIALYPDPLIAQILPASTFLDQIDEAARYVRQYGGAARIDEQPWDVSVKAIAHYPSILYMMDQKDDWTAALGQAYVEQPQDVMDAIQRLRADAMTAGNLASTAEQQVNSDGGEISIVPASPEYIYVPVYDPGVVYLERPDPYAGFVTFSVGLAIGAWLDRDCDWRGRRVYYHGWHGRGWVTRSRPHIHDTNRVYINRNVEVINVNRRVLQHDTLRYRAAMRRDVERRRSSAPSAVTITHPRREGGPISRPRTVPVAPVPRTVSPAATATSAPQASGSRVRPETTNVFRGRDVQSTHPASHSGYGGYGSGRDATVYQERGRFSRERVHQAAPAATAPRPSAAPRAAPRAAPMSRPAPTPSAPPAGTRGGGGGGGGAGGFSGRHR